MLLAALGASARQRGRFLTAEGSALLLGGIAGGAALAAAISYLLIKVLTGIFDPPPSTPSVPYGYLALLAGAVVLTSGLVVLVMGRLAGRAGPQELRSL